MTLGVIGSRSFEDYRIEGIKLKSILNSVGFDIKRESLNSIRSRSRNLVMNTPQADGAIDSFVSNMIG